jgi:hypothetical protein
LSLMQEEETETTENERSVATLKSEISDFKSRLATENCPPCVARRAKRGQLITEV